jgi:hypothetical protein
VAAIRWIAAILGRYTSAPVPAVRADRVELLELTCSRQRMGRIARDADIRPDS